VMVNTRSLETEPSEGRTTTVSLLKTRRAEYAGADEWLVELDRRIAEIKGEA
jgi:hypothetical protein